MMGAHRVTGNMAAGAGRSFIALLLVTTACQQNAMLLEPDIIYTPQQRHIEELPSAFPTLSANERDTPWGREMLIGRAFARELDLYRAITAYKRALVLLPACEQPRRDQITYDIILCYYLGGKYQEAIETFESSELRDATAASFPAFGDLLILLYEAYRQDCRFERAEAIRSVIEKCSPETADDLTLSEAILNGNIASTRCLAEGRLDEREVTSWLNCYCAEAKSVRAAQWLNGLLPGAGYLYVGQAKTALTSLILNGLFIAATYQFFDHHYPAAAIITLSLEAGWYFGGINGAGLAAKEYNQRLYENYGKEILVETRLFPIMMFEYAF
jgi:tetratricopeptide (TPR) repeat protein